MRLLDRYVLRELLVPLGYCLCGFMVFWIASDLFVNLGEFQDNKLSPAEVATYYLLIAPDFLVKVLPIALLLALLYTLTNLARHHEITAMRTAGVSLWRLCLPYLAVGFLVSLASLAINELWVPDSTDAAERIRLLHTAPRAGRAGLGEVRHLGFNNAREQRIWQISLYRPDSAEMIEPKVFSTLPDGSRALLKADRGVWTNDVWLFVNVLEYQETTNSLGTGWVPSLQTNLLARPDFTETPEEIRSEIRISDSISLRAGAKRADVPIAEILNYLRLHPNPSRFDSFWLHTRLQGRLASPWTCLVVVLIAIPFGAASGRRNVFFGVAGSVFICFSYIVFQQFGLALGTGGYLPPWIAAWSPNLFFGLTGIVLTSRVR